MATYWENSCSFGLRYVSWYKYLIVSLVFSHLGFWSGNLFLIAPFPDLCLLVPFHHTNVLLVYYFLASLVFVCNNHFIMKFLNAHLMKNMSGCNFVKSVRKDTEFSALVQNGYSYIKQITND